jgi:hypothetical protein
MIVYLRVIVYLMVPFFMEPCLNIIIAIVFALRTFITIKAMNA